MNSFCYLGLIELRSEPQTGGKLQEYRSRYMTIRKQVLKPGLLLRKLLNWGNHIIYSIYIYRYIPIIITRLKFLKFPNGNPVRLFSVELKHASGILRGCG